MTTKSLINATWLHEHLSNENIRVIDASWHMPSAHRNGHEEFLEETIPDAVFFDIDAVSDKTSDYPHMLPNEMQLSEAMTSLGIGNHHHVIIYDTLGLFSAARLWWMLQYFGHNNVSVLDGGLPAWKAQGYKTEQGSAPISSQNPYIIENKLTNRVVLKDEVKRAIEEGTHTIYDARGGARFAGTTPEPRAGVRSGHMKGAINIPFTSLLNEDSTMKSEAELKDLLTETNKPIITSCGSGVTACIISLALTTLGRESSVYDGSWSEWGASDDTEVVTD